jgi:hypothetical protein
MNLQYLKDDNNTTTAVVIPISDWEKITRTHQDINLMIEVKTTNSQKSKPSDFFGTLTKEDGERMQAHVTKSRNEWERNS